MSNLISRQDALKPFCIAQDGTRIPEVDCDNFPVEFSVEFIKKHLLSLPSAETPTVSEKHQLSEETPTNTPTDLISRQYAIKTFFNPESGGTYGELDDGSEWYMTSKQIYAVLESLPSAEPNTKCVAQIRINRDDMEDLVNKKVNEIVDKMVELKTGKWVEVEKNEYEGFSIVNMRCNQCGRYAYLVLPKGTQCVYDYCPWCKADMRGERDDSISD